MSLWERRFTNDGPGVLTSIGVQHIFDNPSDISRFKPATYALSTVKEKGKTEYDGCETAYVDDYGKGVRKYHIRRYSLEQSLSVRLAAAAALQKIFMEKIGTHFVDAENYRVDLEIEGVRVVQDEAVIANGAGAVELDIVFCGGIYVRRETRLITGVDTETELIQTQKRRPEEMAQKTEVKNSLKSIEELAKEQNLKAWVFAGVKAEKKWAAGRVVTEAEFKKAVTGWLKAPMHGGKEK